ncbi:MAG: hypothetical protein P1U74_05220 [Legionellaceae bacterium]|nr:hypothetical protein [Legionellaceae bacterium]
MTRKVFSERLNNELNSIGMPERMDERVVTFSKVFKTPKYKSEAILNGNIIPDSELLKQLAEELEVSTAWLLGDDKDRH